MCQSSLRSLHTSHDTRAVQQVDPEGRLKLCELGWNISVPSVKWVDVSTAPCNYVMTTGTKREEGRAARHAKKLCVIHM